MTEWWVRDSDYVYIPYIWSYRVPCKEYKGRDYTTCKISWYLIDRIGLSLSLSNTAENTNILVSRVALRVFFICNVYVCNSFRIVKHSGPNFSLLKQRGSRDSLAVNLCSLLTFSRYNTPVLSRVAWPGVKRLVSNRTMYISQPKAPHITTNN